MSTASTPIPITHGGRLRGAHGAIVTATAVGYGDSFPTHLAGKIVAVWLMVTMVLLIIPAITAHMASRLIVDADAFTHEEQEEIKSLLREIHGHLHERTGP